MFCEYCGAIIKENSKYCEVCGRTTEFGKNLMKSPFISEPNYDLFRENKASRGERQKGEIAPPEMWMYIAAFLLPMLGWILIGVYASKGQFQYAEELFVKPLVASLIIYGIAFLIILFAVIIPNC